MGLDMYLRAREVKFNWKETDKTMGAVDFTETHHRLVYWRKHPDLHGYIVDTYAEGKDECQRIYLSLGDLKNILAASESDSLPDTKGFFFGDSRPEDKEYTKNQLLEAIEWLQKGEREHRMDIYYEASW